MRPENVGSVESAAAGRRAAPHGGREGTEKKEVEQPKSISLSCYRNCPTNGGKRHRDLVSRLKILHPGGDVNPGDRKADLGKRI